MTISHTQLIQQMNNSKAMRDLDAMTRATAAMTRRADALLQSSGPDQATVDQAVREALIRDGALPASAHHPAPGVPAPLPRQTLAAALAMADAGVSINLGNAHQTPGGLQDAPTATSATTTVGAAREAQAGTAPQATAVDNAAQAINDAVGSLFGLPPSGSPTPPRRGR